MAFGTSHVALLHRAKLHKGQTALILGAAGGVGTAAVQVGSMLCQATSDSHDSIYTPLENCTDSKVFCCNCHAGHSCP